MTDGKLQWHPAFIAALHVEFEDEMDALEIEAEHLLGKKPMQIDALIIKKADKTVIRKNIGQIFRRYNVVEYKSPEDSLSINDFYKVYAYACLLQSDTGHVNEIPPDELTITYVCGHYPREMMKRLEKGRKLKVQKKASGIYYLAGDEFPIQVIVTKELSRDENYWLQNLRKDLKAGHEIQDLVKKYEEKKQDTYYQALMDLIVRANWEQMEEEKKMCEALKELFAEDFKRVEEESIKKGEQRTIKIFRLSAAGTPVEAIAKQCGVTVEKVCQILG